MVEATAMVDGIRRGECRSISSAANALSVGRKRES